LSIEEVVVSRAGGVDIRKLVLFGFLALGVGLALVACDFSYGGGPGGPVLTSDVAIRNMSFQPGNAQVTVGTTVTWTNDDTVAHTVTSDGGVFDSGRMNPGDTWSFTFTTAEAFAYHCSIHTGMHGTIVVTP
jgi:plastocyanin